MCGLEWVMVMITSLRTIPVVINQTISSEQKLKNALEETIPVLKHRKEEMLPRIFYW